MKSAFLKLTVVALGAASALNTYSADTPAAAAIKAGPGTNPGTAPNATTPVALPGKGPAQHPFLYAGELDTRKPQE